MRKAAARAVPAMPSELTFATAAVRWFSGLVPDVITTEQVVPDERNWISQSGSPAPHGQARRRAVTGLAPRLADS